MNNHAEILDSLNTFCKGVIEIRAMNSKTTSGYYNDYALAAKAIQALDGNFPAIYFVLNEINPACLARAKNRYRQIYKEPTTADIDIIMRRWLPIDVDPKRPSGVSATNEEHEYSLQKTSTIREYLWSIGWGDPIFSSSGNGGHLCYRLDLANNAENTALIKDFLAALAQKFSDNRADVDTSVFNASRIWKVYGTLAGKGDSLPERPHRRAKILDKPETVGMISGQQLKTFIEKHSEKKTIAKPLAINTLNVEEFCLKHSIEILRSEKLAEGVKFVLRECPWNSQHKDAAIIQHTSGAIAFKCFHNSCQTNTWKELREKFDPETLRKKAEPAKLVANKAEQMQNALQRKVSAAGCGIDNRFNAVKDLCAMDEELNLQEKGILTTIPMPWNKLSLLCRALRPGNVFLIAGQEKAGKTYFAMNLVLNLFDQGHEFKYLPLEDDRKSWLWRAMAIKTNNYILTQDDQETVPFRREALYAHNEWSGKILNRVAENPRVGVKNANGETILPVIDQGKIIHWIKSNISNTRFLVIDPIAQIEFSGFKKFEAEAAFVRQVVGLVADKNCTIILLCHTQKGNVEAIQGAAELTRLTQTSIIIERHEEKQSVCKIHGSEVTCEHNRTITISCARNGSGTGRKIAFSQGSNGPIFDEYGIIKSKKGK